MNKLFAAIVVLMFVLSGVSVAVAQEDSGKETRGKKLTHRYNVVFHEAEKIRIGMEATIAYVNELGNDSTTLSNIKTDFVAKVAELKSAAENNDFSGFQNALADIKTLIKSFRIAAHAILGNNVGEAQSRVAKALQDNREYLNSLVQNISRSQGEAEIEEIDQAVNETEKKAERAESQGVNVSALRSKLAEIKEKRTELKARHAAAVESCKGTGLGECNTTEAEAYRALKAEIKQDFRELRDIARSIGQAHRIANNIDAAKKVLNRTEALVSRMKEEGVDTAVLEAKLDEVRKLIESAEAKLKAGDFSGALEELKDAREAFKSTAKEIREASREVRRERREERVENRSEGAAETERERGPRDRERGKS